MTAEHGLRDEGYITGNDGLLEREKEISLAVDH